MPPAPLLPAPILRSIMLLATALVGLVAAMTALPYVVRLETSAWLSASVATALMVRWTASLASRRPGDGSAAVARCIGWGMVMGVLDVGVAFCAAAATGPSMGPRSLVLAPLAMMVGVPAGMGLGVVFGVGLSVPVAALLIAWHWRTPDATDGAAAAIGVWVAGMVAVLAWLPVPSLSPAFSLWPHGDVPPLDPLQQIWLRGVALVIGLGGIGLAVLAGDRALQRRRFVRSAARGGRPGWRVEAVGQPGLGLALPRLGGRPEDCGHALVRVEQPGEGAYRRAEVSWPFALVPSRWLGR